MTDFASLGLARPILQAIEAEGYTTPTPIQQKVVPVAMAGRDVVGIAQTGTGKTAGFALPILHRLGAAPKRPAPRSCRVLVLSPTRELASQIGESFQRYGARLGIRVAVVFGGVKHGAQVKALSPGVDVLVACPGRLLDHMADRAINLADVEYFVLDEADQMLDLGFLPSIRKVVRALPAKRQNLFFSATMPKEIRALAADLLTDPEEVAVTPPAATADRIAQEVIFVEQARKRLVLADLYADPDFSRTLVFSRTKHGADRLQKHLESCGVSAAAIHGNKSQGQRERALDMFKRGQLRALVATDIAARGIDVDGVTHVVNFDLPNVSESYVHRIGRTARAGADGRAVSLVGDDERGLLKDIEKLIRREIPRTDRRLAKGQPMEPEAAAMNSERAARPNGQRRGPPPHHGRSAGPARPKTGADRRPQTNGGHGQREADDGHMPAWLRNPARSPVSIPAARPAADERRPEGARPRRRRRRGGGGGNRTGSASAAG